MGEIVQLNEGEIKSQLGEMVRIPVEDTPAGHYTRKLGTKAGGK